MISQRIAIRQYGQKLRLLKSSKSFIMTLQTRGTWLMYDITKNSVIFRVAIIELCSEAIHLNTPKYKVT